jgi:hypothetical protein
MGAAAESVSVEKEAPSRGAEAGGTQGAAASPGFAFDPFVDRLFGGSPAEPPDSAAGSLAIQRLKAPLMQRAQRLYGNRASQRMVQRAGVIQRQCACGGKCPKCQDEAQKRMLQRSSGAPAPADFGGIPSSHGAPLDAAAREPLETHFNADLSAVRVHTRADDAESANQLQALAYTSGRDIYFAAGMYAPSSSSGRHLLAHEVAHVVQQSSGQEPSIAAKSLHGAKIGAPDDPLEEEAERKAEEFMSGSQPGELSDEEQRRRSDRGVVQRFIQRQSAPAPPASNAPPSPDAGKPPAPQPDAGAPDPTPPKPAAPPTPQGEIVKTLDGVQLVADPVFMRYQLEQLTIQGSSHAPYSFLDRLQHDYDTDEMAGDRAFKQDYEKNQGAVSAGVPRPQEDFDAYDQSKPKELKVIEVVRPIVDDLGSEHAQFISDVEGLAKGTALNTLDANEKEDKAEALRYGITWETIQKPVSDCLAGDCTITETKYSMGGDNPALTGLQSAAKLLLERHQTLDDAKAEMDDAHAEADDGAGVDVYTRREAADKKYQDASKGYEMVRGYLAAKYPILDAFTGDNQNTADLQRLASQKAGPDTAALLGAEIVKRLANIEKVRKGLDNPGDVNVWRLPHVVEIATRQAGADVDPLKKKWIDEKVEYEQPGIWESIALLVLNLVALALAAPTGGASLVVMAGVNAVVAAQHVNDYLMQQALSGTAFDKARALSQDEPSFFWLAVEIVGVAVDFVSAFKAVSAAAKALQEAKAAEDAVRVARETENLKNVARQYGGEEFARRVATEAVEGAGAESKAIKALNLTEDETKLLQAGERELEETGVLAERVTSTGRVKVDNAGRLWACASPCQWARDKFAQELAGDPALEAELSAIEKKAADAAKAGDMAKVAEAENEAVAFTDKVARVRFAPLMKQIRSQFPKLKDLDDGALQRILAKGTQAPQVKGQLLEELVNARMADPAEIASHVPAGVAKRLEQEGVKLEFIPGHEILDANGSMISDGLIGYWKDGEFQIVTFFESKAGGAAARGLRRSWTGIPKAERAGILKEAQTSGLAAFREADQNAAEALSEAAEAVRENKKLTMDLDEVLKQFPDDVEKQWLKLPQGEAGQIRKTTERLGGQLMIRGKMTDVTTVSGTLGKGGTIATGGIPHAVGVLPADVAEKTLEDALKEGGIKSFERMKGVTVTQSELNDMSEQIATMNKGGAPAP